MIINTRTWLTLTAIALSTILLAACGESDLEDQHAGEIEAARAALSDQAAQTPVAEESEQPALGAASEEMNEPSETGGEADALTAQPTMGAPDAGLDLAEYELVFQDEFAGSSIDSTKWNTALPWGPDDTINDELQYYVDVQSDPDFGFDPFVLDGTTLTVTASPTPEGYEERANDQGWLSGALSSHEKFAFTHGYVEARMDVPAGQGIWPAFWMLSSEFNGRKPQLFILEHDGSAPDSVFLNYNFENDEGQLSTYGQKEFTVDGFGEGFNTVGIEWSPDAMKYFVNGQLLRTLPAGDLPEQDMYLILNLAIGGTFVGDPDASTPSEPAYQIDYVRVYQKP